MIDLTADQRQALRAEGKPLRLRDPDTNDTYVLIKSEVYERVQALFVKEDKNEFLHAMYPHVMEVFGREGWDDPSMDVYDELDPRRQA